MRRYAVAPDHGRPSSDEPEAGIGMSRTTHSMHGKTVLITGGTGGIDRAAAIGLLLALMHPIAWKGCSANFGLRGWSLLRQGQENSRAQQQVDDPAELRVRARDHPVP